MSDLDNGVEKTSVWKKEISFRRKPKNEARAADAPATTSIWKKEISLGRRKQAEPDLVAAVSEPEAAVVSEPEPVVAAEPTPVAALADDAPPIEHDWLTVPLEDVSLPPDDPQPFAVVPAEPVPAEAALELVPEPVASETFSPASFAPETVAAALPSPAPEPIHPPVPAAGGFGIRLVGLAAGVLGTSGR